MRKPRQLLKLGALCAALGLGHAETAAAQQVTDVLGRKVDVSDHVKRVVLGEGRLISAFALLDKDAPFQRIVGWQNDLKLLDQHTYNAYVAKFPTVKDIPLIGQASEQSVSTEEILSLKPDLAVFSISGHGPTEHSAVADVLAKAGIPVVFVDFRVNPVQGTHTSMTALGQALGREAQAKAFLNFYDAHIKVITDAVATLPAGPRPSVFLELLAGAWQAPGHTTGKSGMGEVIKLVGGRNIAADVVPGALGDISVEYALKADPDVYVATGNHKPGLILGAGVSTALRVANVDGIPLSSYACLREAFAALQRIGIAHLADQLLSTLSGGQRQLVSLAQLIARRPQVMLLDEPTSALDLNYQLKVMDCVRGLVREHQLIAVVYGVQVRIERCSQQSLQVLVDGAVA